MARVKRGFIVDGELVYKAQGKVVEYEALPSDFDEERQSAREGAPEYRGGLIFVPLIIEELPEDDDGDEFGEFGDGEWD